MEQHAEVLHGNAWRPYLPGRRDVLVIVLIFAMLITLAMGARQMAGPLVTVRAAQISLSLSALPAYTLRTVLRMLAALAASLVFTLTYATLAAKSRRAEMVLIPLLDVLQSVPILGYLSFTIVFFMSLFPGNVLGAELAAIFAIFTSQAWNMAFSFYQSLRTVPLDLDDASRSYRLSVWQRFWRLEVPFALPGLVWNAIMSMSGGWFFVVASEAISVGNVQIALPGVGSYVARAIQARDLGAIGWALLAMTVTIVLYDQLLFRPIVAWADKFRAEQTASQQQPRSWLLDLVRRATFLQRAGAPLGRFLRKVARARMRPPFALALPRLTVSQKLGDRIWYACCALVVAYSLNHLFQFVRPVLTWTDLSQVVRNGLLTMSRVLVLVFLASIVWVPVGIVVGLRPRWAERVQPIAQFLAAFPANLLFPVAVYLIVHLRLTPQIWLSPLMILGTQWYILFNVVAGATAFPTDLREAAASLRLRPLAWWRQVMLPGILPYYVTGAITATGGAWNASIVSEVVSWGNTRLDASGLGAYIARMTDAGDYPHIALGVATMSVLVIATNRLLWRPMYAFAERRTRLG